VEFLRSFWRNEPVPGKIYNPWLVAFTVALTTFMEVLDISIANVALRNIAGDMGAGQDESTWVLTSYMVSNAVILPMSGWLSQVLGRRRFYMICVLLFTISSLLCGLAPNLGFLIFFRVLQGIGGGGLQPCSQAIITDSFSLEKRGMAFALYGVTTVLAPAIGPTLGGWITDSFVWRWIFLINVPVGILSLILTSKLVFDPPHFVEHIRKLKRDGFHIDTIGFALIILGFGCLQVLLDKGQQEDWFESQFIIAMAAVSVVSLILLPFWELRQKNPMMDIRLLAERNFLIGNVLMFMLGFVLFSSTVLLPLFVQSLMGYTATDAGMLLSPGGIAVLFIMPMIGMMTGKVDARLMIGTGILLNAISLFAMSFMNLQADYWTLASLRIIQGIGLGFLFIPINATALTGLPPTSTSNASAIINLSRNLGGGFGISLMQTWLVRDTETHRSYLVTHVDATSQQIKDLLSGLTQNFMQHGASLMDATHQAYAALNSMLQQQASLLAFMDNFRLLALLFLANIPMLFLMKWVPFKELAKKQKG
jgi:DHA2 family multidrug resistance protein